MRHTSNPRSVRRGARPVSASRLALAGLRRRLGPWAGPAIFAALALVTLAAAAIVAPHVTPAIATVPAGPAQPLTTSNGADASQPPDLQLGVFSLTGQPLPVPAYVLRPTNMARTRDGSVVTTVYAGALASHPQVGALFVLRDDYTTGQQTKHLYQTSRPVGALTIVAARGSALSLTFPGGGGTFDLSTGTFNF
ncbi:MAG TPA: hypothetical protein VF818_09445 [Ktedonobacterales bacterium]